MYLILLLAQFAFAEHKAPSMVEETKPTASVARPSYKLPPITLVFDGEKTESAHLEVAKIRAKSPCVKNLLNNIKDALNPRSSFGKKIEKMTEGKVGEESITIELHTKPIFTNQKPACEIDDVKYYIAVSGKILVTSVTGTPGGDPKYFSENFSSEDAQLNVNQVSDKLVSSLGSRLETCTLHENKCVFTKPDATLEKAKKDLKEDRFFKGLK